MLLLAGCTQAPPPSTVASPVSVGDVWTYQVHVDENATLRSEAVVAFESLAWGGKPLDVITRAFQLRPDEWSHGEIRSAVSWTDRAGAPLGWMAVVPIDAGEMTIHRTTDKPCPEVPAELKEGETLRVACRVTFHRVMPWGDTMERQSAAFERHARVIGLERVEVPAGAFDAWHIQVADVYDLSLQPEYELDLWYAPEACAIAKRVTPRFTEVLSAVRCQATGFEAGALPALGAPDIPAAQRESKPPRLGCTAVATGVGANGMVVEPAPAVCEPGFHMFSFDGLRNATVTASWHDSPGLLGVRLQAGGLEAAGAQPPVTLHLPASALQQDLAARVRVDGAARDVPVSVTYDFT
jgi:hypothetical protein